MQLEKSGRRAVGKCEGLTEELIVFGRSLVFLRVRWGAIGGL